MSDYGHCYQPGPSDAECDLSVSDADDYERKCRECRSPAQRGRTLCERCEYDAAGGRVGE